MKRIKLIGSALNTIGLCLFFVGFKVKDFNLFFLIVGGIFTLIGFIAVLHIDKRERKNTIKQYTTWRNDLKSNGIKIEVDLDKVEVKSQSYREEIDNNYPFTSQYMALDALIGKETQEYQNIEQCILVYKTDVQGNARTFHSPIIPKDEATLTFLLFSQKTTWIYADRLVKENYYFDLDFLRT